MVMVESKSRWRRTLLSAYLRWKYFQRFHAVRVSGFPGWRDWLTSDDAFPLILFGNHQTWWDGLLDFSLTQRFGIDLHLMMEAKNLRKFPYFQKCGVFGVDLDSPRGRAEGLLHAAEILRRAEPRTGLVIYPHGRLVADWETPPAMQGGVLKLLARAPTSKAVPIYHRLALGKHERPEVDLRIGRPLDGTSASSAGALEVALSAARAALHTDLENGFNEEVVYVSGPRRFSRGET